jgi:glycosyltransferase involved in cell wall biosynthesis
MRLLLINQFFPPDIAPTGQMAAELAEDLVVEGIEVTALASRGSYLGGARLPERNAWRGVDVRRLSATSLGKGSLLHRALDYGSFHAAAAWALARLPRHDVVVAMTTPPLIAATGLVARALRGSRLVYWVQDLYPEIAVAFGALGPQSAAARTMGAISRKVMHSADRVVVLGEAMAERAVAAGAAAGKVAVIPNWADGEVVRPIRHEQNSLRPEIAQGARFVAMYSGNIGRAHDVQTLAGAVGLLKARTDIAFVFLGEGDRKAELELATRGLPNVRFAPYEPRERLAQSLSAADVHLVSLAPDVVGLLEPSKLYGVMAAGRPALYVGPARAEVARTIEAERCGLVFHNGDAEGLAGAISSLADDPPRCAELGLSGREAFLARFDRHVRTAQFADLLRNLA